MAQISIRLSDEQEQRLRKSAKTHNIQFTVYLRELLGLGEQVKGASEQQTPALTNKLPSSESTTMPKIIMAVSENRYLMRYLIGKLFKEEGETARQIAREQAEKEIHEDGNN